MKDDLRRLYEDIDRAVRVIRTLKKENEKLNSSLMLKDEQIRALDSEGKNSEKMARDFERMKLERIKIKDKVGVLLNALGDVQ
ncbi:MAG: hypothetical protein COS41_04115 [Elusimicrobia bacterium CG03_land_8_20_14_0_80_50_18]|nr:MAG: hypothetical protein COS41_04115 [Elusimicrobia bacterium CG03_land_8_20_14_0_80_50_18]PIX15065.1 MAG: hypothetical protein COZ72_04435 [Elusimicrobia bacterium CG_4_8_14_3_um_filter_50_9]